MFFVFLGDDAGPGRIEISNYRGVINKHVK